jgi:hypothetical protein
MFEIEVSGAAQLTRIAKSGLMKRAVAFEYLLVRDVVEKVFDAIQEGLSDTTNEEWMKIYKKSLKVHEITGLPKSVGANQTPELGFAITAQVPGDWSMVNADTMLVDFKRKLDDPAASIGEVLEQFSPFTVENVPNLDAYGAKVGIRVVRPSEVEEIRERNSDKAYELQEALQEQGVSPKSGQAQIEGKIFFDMEWAVIHMETKHSAYGAPHWRPALKQIGTFLKKLSTNVDFHKKIKKIFDPENVRWGSSAKGMNALPTIRVNDIKGFEKFQTQISQSHM